jgi:hypothetical protein
MHSILDRMGITVVSVDGLSFVDLTAFLSECVIVYAVFGAFAGLDGGEHRSKGYEDEEIEIHIEVRFVFCCDCRF